MENKIDTVKKNTRNLLEKLFNKLTPTGARITSAVITAIILVLFLATSTGRDIIVFIGYVGVILCILYLGYLLYKFAIKNAKVPEVSEDSKNEETEFVIEPENEEESKEHQMTIDEIVDEAEEENEKEDDFSVEDIK